jgi:hypothetical protein
MGDTMTAIEQFWNDVEALRQRKNREDLENAQKSVVDQKVEQTPAAGEHTSWCKIQVPGGFCNCPRAWDI